MHTFVCLHIHRSVILGNPFYLINTHYLDIGSYSKSLQIQVKTVARSKKHMGDNNAITWRSSRPSPAVKRMVYVFILKKTMHIGYLPCYLNIRSFTCSLTLIIKIGWAVKSFRLLCQEK